MMSKTEKTLPLDRDLEMMLISAERYAFGRRSYVVGTTVDYLISLLPRLSDWCKDVLLRDLTDERERADRIGNWDYWGDECDKRAWLRFLDALNEERKAEDNG